MAYLLYQYGGSTNTEEGSTKSAPLVLLKSWGGWTDTKMELEAKSRRICGQNKIRQYGNWRHISVPAINVTVLDHSSTRPERESTVVPSVCSSHTPLYTCRHKAASRQCVSGPSRGKTVLSSLPTKSVTSAFFIGFYLHCLLCQLPPRYD